MAFPRFKLFPILLILILAFLQYKFWFKPGGVLEVQHLKKEVIANRQENDKLKNRNELLMAQVYHVKQNKEAVESRARRELGMIKKGEVFYQIVK